MLAAEILPGKLTLPNVPKMEFPGVRLGPVPDWERAIGLGAAFGVVAAGLTVLFLTRQRKAPRKSTK